MDPDDAGDVLEGGHGRKLLSFPVQVDRRILGPQADGPLERPKKGLRAGGPRLQDYAARVNLSVHGQ